MIASNPFSDLDVAQLDQAARQQGFRRKGQRNWVRRTADFVQLINLQKSQWSGEEHYLNFALWPLTMGEPPTVAESKFQFRTRGENTGANDLVGFFLAVDRMSTLSDLRTAVQSGSVSGLMSKELRGLLA